MPLVEHATAPERVYTHAWEPGDLLIWDNRATMHSATQVDIYRDEIRHRRRSYSFMGEDALPGGKLKNYVTKDPATIAGGISLRINRIM